MAELIFFTGTMDCGKSTLALQMNHNHAARGRQGLIFSRYDRAGDSVLSSRLGLSHAALEVTAGTHFWDDVVRHASRGRRIDYVICDEAQFYSPEQVEQLARLVDEMGIDVYAFGITADFRARLFPGSQRLIELCDRTEVLQVRALCWCGRTATHNARTVDDVMVVHGEQVVVGDVGDQPTDSTNTSELVDRSAEEHVEATAFTGKVEYEVLCRRHYMRRMTARAARAQSLSPDLLPFDLDLCPVPTTSGSRAARESIP
ncbi:MAG: thymidine kinase [Ornithinimicrobium sp.]